MTEIRGRVPGGLRSSREHVADIRGAWGGGGPGHNLKLPLTGCQDAEIEAEVENKLAVWRIAPVKLLRELGRR